MIFEGRVIEQGTHDELMALQQEYYSLVTTQVQSSEAVSKLEKQNSVGADDLDNISVGKEVVGVMHLNL